MNRRGFFKSLGLAIGVAAVAPAVLIPRASDAFKWKRASGIWVLNPEWVNAPYEIGYCWIDPDPRTITPVIHTRYINTNNLEKCCYPLRLNRDGKIVPLLVEV